MPLLRSDDGVAFLSYSTLDKKLAGSVKDGLALFGFEVFLAHEDLVPSDEWRSRIRDELARCDAFVPLISENFRSSEWTDQESGYALSRGRQCLIVSIVVPPVKVPHGFLKDFQAVKLNVNVPDATCEDVSRAISGKLGSGLARKGRVIERFSRSNSFASAKRNARGLSGFDNFSQQEMDWILLACVSNYQIYGPLNLRPRLKTLFGQHGHVASPAVRDRFLQQFH